MPCLRALQDKVETFFPNLNRGGCGVFAAIVGEKLEALGLPVCCRILMPHARLANVQEARRNNAADLYDWAFHGNIEMHHAILEFEFGGQKWFFDSGTLTNDPTEFFRPEALVKEPVTVEEMATMAKSPAGWNLTFNRGDIPTIQELVDFVMKPLFV